MVLLRSLPRFSYSLDTLRGDIFGGVTAAVVGLPVALAFGVASGLGATAGLYGAIAVGFFAAVFGGTKSQISGPTGSMSVAMAVIVTMHADSLAEAFTIAIMAGVIQILLGVLRIGRFVSYTPYSVTSGFMSGIGIIIILIQTLPFLGWPVPTGGPLEAIRAWPEALGDINFGALGIAAVTLVVAVAWPVRFRKYFPPTLAALAVGTTIGVLLLTNTPVIGDIPMGLPSLRMPDLAPGVLAGAVEPAILIALLGSIDSLLTSLIADSMTRTQHNPNRELVGQGLGNVAAGFLWGLPGAGSTPGTVVNLRAGGRTPVSGVLRAAILLALVLGLGPLAEEMPHAVLAGILMKVGWDIIDWRFLTRLLRVQREHLLVMVITLGFTVFLDLVTAVAIGLIAAGVASARQFERLQLDSVVSVPLLDRSFFAGGESPDDVDAFSRTGRAGGAARQLHSGILDQADQHHQRRHPRPRGGDPRLLRDGLHRRQRGAGGRTARRYCSLGGHGGHRHGAQRRGAEVGRGAQRPRPGSRRPLRRKHGRGASDRPTAPGPVAAA